MKGQLRPVLAALVRQIVREFSAITSPPCDNGCGARATVAIYQQGYCTGCWLQVPADEIRRRAGLRELPR